MYYIFDSTGSCIGACNYMMSKNDADLRNETCVQSNEAYNMSKIRLKNGLIEVIEEDSEEITEKKLLSSKNTKITELKRLLRDTDYQAIKFAEGELTLEEFSSTKEKRKNWRNLITQIEVCNTKEAVDLITWK